MRRFTAILLTFCFGAFLLAPLLASTNDSSLPACCRKAGRHHCALAERSDLGSTPAVSAGPEKCPSFPRSAIVSQIRTLIPASVRSLDSAIYAQPGGTAQIEARYRISFSRARQKRAPPATL